MKIHNLIVTKLTKTAYGRCHTSSRYINVLQFKNSVKLECYYHFIFYSARVDLAGAWTDTPPQAYEFSGLVSTLAIKICGKLSIYCRTGFENSIIVEYFVDVAGVY